MGSLLSSLLGRIAIGVVAVIVVVVGWFFLQIEPLFSSQGKSVIITVQSGESISTIASALHAKGVIASPFAFRLDTLVSSISVTPGSYELHQHSSFGAVRSILTSLPNVVDIDVTAGLTLHEVAVDVANAMGATYGNAFAAAATQAATPSTFSSPSSLEGLIGTGNYIIQPGESPQSLARRMVRGFEKEAASEGLTPTSTLNGLNAYQLVIAASIVEKEGYYPVNMPDVSRVIYNRLARGGPLQMDATVLYYLGKDGGTVTPTMLQTQEPYNTYLNTGLTPTPICAVSTIALHATLHPPVGSWLYFTLINKDGTMKFSTTFAQQLAAEKLAQSRGIG
jgi:UPF0755 protein